MSILFISPFPHQFNKLKLTINNNVPKLKGVFHMHVAVGNGGSQWSNISISARLNVSPRDVELGNKRIRRINKVGSIEWNRF